MKRRSLLVILRCALLALTVFAGLVPATAAESIIVFAAISLKQPLDEAAKSFTRKNGIEVRLNYASSAVLARQIEQGAPADIFASADLEWMDYVAAKGLIASETRVNLLGNQLVLVAPATAPHDSVPLDAQSLARILGAGRLATGDVNSVPAGKYAKSALENLGLWDGVRDRLAGAENVRAALNFVARGEAPLGIVYATDASAEPKVKIVARFPAGSHPPIIYPFAMTRSARPATVELLEYLKSQEGAAGFAAAGFAVLAKTAK